MLGVAALLLGAVLMKGAVSAFTSNVSSADDLPRYPTARRLGPGHPECPQSEPFDYWRPTLQVADAIPLTYGVPVVDWEAYTVQPTVPFADVEAYYAKALARDAFSPDQASTRWVLDYAPAFPGEVRMQAYVRSRTDAFGKDVMDVAVLLFQNDRDVNAGQLERALGPVYALFYAHGPVPPDDSQVGNVSALYSQRQDSLRLAHRPPPYALTSDAMVPDCRP